MTCYQSSIVSTAIFFFTIFELLDVEKSRLGVTTCTSLKSRPGAIFLPSIVFIRFYTGKVVRDGRSRSFKVVEIAIEKLIYNFLLVFHWNYAYLLLFPRFNDILVRNLRFSPFYQFTYRLKPSQWRFRWDIRYKSWYIKTNVPGLPDGENRSILYGL